MSGYISDKLFAVYGIEYKLNTSAFKILNPSPDIQQMSGEGMIDYKSIGISSDQVLKKKKGILQQVSNKKRGRRNVHMNV